MKAMSKITIGLVAAAVLMVGCGETAKESPVAAAPVKKVTVAPTITEASLGLRKTDLYSEDSTIAAKTEYRTSQAMGSTKIKRAFQDAPPMIPHDVEGMLPIKIGETPIPVSHFTNFRPNNKVVNGTFQKEVDNYKNEVSIKKVNHLYGGRYNCSQCHAPQSQGNLAVENTFEPAYTSPDGASKSSWNESKYTKSLKTVIGGPSVVTDADRANKNSAAGASIWTHHK